VIITQKAISRRIALRGLGASVTLPLLDAMVPALAAPAKALAKAPRFSVVYVPNGMAMKNWTPAAEGAGFELTPILQPLAAFRDDLLVLSGLNSRQGPGGVHANKSTAFLTGVLPAMSEYDLKAGVSVDQILAQHLGKNTQLMSLELALDSHDVSGACDTGFACAYTNTISWRSPTMPLLMENNPRAVFERLFGDSGSTDPAKRLARMAEQRSLLDSLAETVADLQRRLGPGDRVRIGEYLDAVRDAERRIQNAEKQSAQGLPDISQPAGVPASYDEHAKLMFDLQVLAFQSDLTRVITFMLGRELTGRTYPEIGVPDSHHPISHHRDDMALYAKLSKINTYHVSLLTYYLDKLRSTPDGDGSLLDHVILLYGAGMSDSNRHDPNNLPLVLAGGATGRITRGRHLVFRKDTPMANLLLTLMEKLGVPMESFSNSSGTLDLASLA
jgi:hypothetical protein